MAILIPAGAALAAFVIAASGGASVPSSSQNTPPVQTVASVDLHRYAGDWFELARFPNRFQRQCAGDVQASYSRRDDGRIDVVNRCRAEDGRVTEARGVARVEDPRTFAKLKVRFAPAVLSFLPFVWGDYWIIGLADDYSWAVVGSPDRQYLWILARTPAIDAARYAAAIEAARANGFDVERLIETSHGDQSSWIRRPAREDPLRSAGARAVPQAAGESSDSTLASR
jgi:apolipoprotein D and lipocalin family protein